jgi:hypothetical protein
VINGRRMGAGDWPGTHAHARRTDDSLSDKSSQAVDDYSADMSEKRQESPGTVGNASTIKTVVQQCFVGGN